MMLFKKVVFLEHVNSLSSVRWSHDGDVVCVPEPTVDPSIANCDFENGLCLYYQEKVENNVWTRVTVKPNAYRTGDHTTGAGGSRRGIYTHTL